jgi:hypothetical protein
VRVFDGAAARLVRTDDPIVSLSEALHLDPHVFPTPAAPHIVDREPADHHAGFDGLPLFLWDPKLSGCLRLSLTQSSGATARSRGQRPRGRAPRSPSNRATFHLLDNLQGSFEAGPRVEPDDAIGTGCGRCGAPAVWWKSGDCGRCSTVALPLIWLIDAKGHDSGGIARSSSRGHVFSSRRHSRRNQETHHG